MEDKVELLYSSPKDELTIGRVAQTCTGYDGAFDVKDADRERLEKILALCYHLEHLSVFEFATCVFRLQIPIYVARQLMRYRSSTFMERSLRHCRPIADDEDAVYANAITLYNKLIEEGFKKEEARAILPLGTPTILIWKIDVRSLFHVFDERNSKTAQSRTKNVVLKMKDAFSNQFPILNSIYDKEKKGC